MGQIIFMNGKERYVKKLCYHMCKNYPNVLNFHHLNVNHFDLDIFVFKSLILLYIILCISR